MELSPIYTIYASEIKIHILASINLYPQTNQDFSIGKIGEIKLPKVLEPITCPNPKCHERIGELVIVTDVSKTPKEQYYACPHCYTKLDWISTQSQEQKKEQKMGKKGSSKCPHHFGYLSTLAYLRGVDFPIPRGCLACSKVLDCAMETGDSE